MGGPHRSKRGGRRLWCFARPPAGSEVPERWSKTPFRGPGAAGGPQNGDKDGQASARQARDSQDELTAYLGTTHRCASSSSILAQAASLADAERRLKGLPEGEAFLGGPPLAQTPASSPPHSTLEGTSSAAGSVCVDSYHHHGIQSPEEVAGARASPTSPFAAVSFHSKASSQAVGTPSAADYLQRAEIDSSGSSAIVDGAAAGTAGTPDQAPKSKAEPGEPHAPLLLGPRESHSEASEVASQGSHSLLSDESGGSDGRAPPGAAVRSFSLPRLVLSDFTQQLSRGGASEGGQLSRVQSRTLILGSLSLSQQLEEDVTDRTCASPSASTVGSHRSSVYRRHTLSAMVLLTDGGSDSDSDEEEESEEVAGQKTVSKGPSLAMSLPSTLHRAPSARSLQRRLSNVFEGHHVPLQKLRRQMGDPKEPPGDLLSLMARRVFSQQDVLSRMDSEGLVSHLDAHSSLLTPQPTADGPLPSLTAVAPAPKLPPIRIRPMADSAKHD